MRRGTLPLLLVGWTASLTFAGDDPGSTVGRVRVTQLNSLENARAADLRVAVEARLPQNVRLLSLRPQAGAPDRFDGTIHDAAAERAYDLVLDAEGKELSRQEVSGQPPRSDAEREEAFRIVRESPLFLEGPEGVRLSETMPPVSTDAVGRRLINVGLMTPRTLGKPVDFHEAVSVHLPSREIVRYASGAPPAGKSVLDLCGPTQEGCAGGTGGVCSFYLVQWPAADPVWSFKVRHPSCTTSVQPDGTGLELTDVRYQDTLILRRAEMPVLNVQYDGNACGPFRDWLFTENCFQVTGVDVPAPGSGIRVASTSPTTFCETGTDDGNFRGVAIYDEGSSLYLVTETDAAWYRYIMGWRLFLDGTLEPVFGYGATDSPCTCLAHTHHGFWRFDWALLNDTLPGPLVLEKRRPVAAPLYDTVGTEQAFVRPAHHPGVDDTFRVLHARTGAGYRIEPGEHDGNASGDAFAKLDVAALVARDTEINDPTLSAPINIDSWVNFEPLGQADRLVTWYRAGFRHDHPSGVEACELTGPRLTPVAACESSLLLDRALYPCTALVSIQLNDLDRCGAGTVSVLATSSSDPVGETVTLQESPGPCGHFEATLPTTTGAPTPTDGALSIADGSDILVRYADASFCGTADFTLEKRATVDCSPPVVSDVQHVVGATTTTVEWTTSEPASTVLHYGGSIPTNLQATGLAGTSHSVTLSNLTPCALYYYWPESTDAAGNGQGNTTGGHFSFRRPRTATITCAPTPPPPPLLEMTASRGASGDIQLAWTKACTADNYHLAVGPLSLVASYATSAGVCGLGPEAHYTWQNVPSGNLWFVVIPDNGDFTEGSWGLDGNGAQRNGATPLGWCSFTQRTNAGACP